MRESSTRGMKRWPLTFPEYNFKICGTSFEFQNRLFQDEVGVQYLEATIWQTSHYFVLALNEDLTAIASKG